MAKNKKKGKPPQQKKPAKKKLSVSQIVFYVLSILMVLSMIIPLLIR